MKPLSNKIQYEKNNLSDAVHRYCDQYFLNRNAFVLPPRICIYGSWLEMSKETMREVFTSALLHDERLPIVDSISLAMGDG